jgi:hypothetical protein
MTPEEALHRLSHALGLLRPCEFTRTRWGLAFRVIWFTSTYSNWHPLAGVSGGHLQAEAEGDGVVVRWVARYSRLYWLTLSFIPAALALAGAEWGAALAVGFFLGALSLLGLSFNAGGLELRLERSLRGWW